MKLFDNISKIFRKFICCPLGYHSGFKVDIDRNFDRQDYGYRGAWLETDYICKHCKNAFGESHIRSKESAIAKKDYIVKSYYFEKTKGMVSDPFNLTKEDLEFIIMVEPSLRFYAELWRTK